MTASLGSALPWRVDRPKTSASNCSQCCIFFTQASSSVLSSLAYSASAVCSPQQRSVREAFRCKLKVAEKIAATTHAATMDRRALGNAVPAQQTRQRSDGSQQSRAVRCNRNVQLVAQRLIGEPQQLLSAALRPARAPTGRHHWRGRRAGGSGPVSARRSSSRRLCLTPARELAASASGRCLAPQLDLLVRLAVCIYVIVLAVVVEPN